jgi:hypothetical protein
MARSTHFIGLTPKAEEFLKTCTLKEKYDVATGMFDEEVCDLNIYTTPTGELVEEYVQCDPWSSGPVIFLSLRTTDGMNSFEEFDWTDEEIDDYI